MTVKRGGSIHSQQIILASPWTISAPSKTAVDEQPMKCWQDICSSQLTLRTQVIGCPAAWRCRRRYSNFREVDCKQLTNSVVKYTAVYELTADVATLYLSQGCSPFINVSASRRLRLSDIRTVAMTYVHRSERHVVVIYKLILYCVSTDTTQYRNKLVKC